LLPFPFPLVLEEEDEDEDEEEEEEEEEKGMQITCSKLVLQEGQLKFLCKDLYRKKQMEQISHRHLHDVTVCKCCSLKSSSQIMHLVSCCSIVGFVHERVVQLWVRVRVPVVWSESGIEKEARDVPLLLLFSLVANFIFFYFSSRGCADEPPFDMVAK